MDMTVKNGIELFPHNQDSYQAAVSGLNGEAHKTAIIHPTGTGKSFIGFKLAEDNPDKTICWLSPSEYIFKTQIENLKETGADEPENIVFFTYAKLMLMSEDDLAEIEPDIIILDEFHRGGAAFWEQGIRNLLNMYPGTPLLGLSATNIRYLDHQRDMAQELFDGNIASEMTLGEAIVRGILAAPKYVLTLYSYQKDLERYRLKIERSKQKVVRDAAQKYYDALKRTLEKSEGLDEIFQKHMIDRTGKYLVFTANIEAMRECIAKVSEWFAKIDKKPHVYSVYSADPTASKSFEDFKNDHDESHLRLLFSIDALNEGVHVEDISGVILFRPTVSPIIYKQQIGRALSASKKKEPVIFDVVNNFDNLYSIGAIGEEMRAAITYYRYFGDGEKIAVDRFQLIDEVQDCKKLFDALENTLTASWDLMYEQAKKYYAEHDDLEVPIDYKTDDDYSLGQWLQSQRQIRAGKITGNLDEEKIAKLDALKMRWESVNDVSWERHYTACKEYRAEHGDLCVPSDYVTESGISLGKWILSVRCYHKTGIKSNYFTQAREKLLNDLGMIWNQPDYIWEQNYAAAMEYHRLHGDLNVPVGYIQNGVKLYNWLTDLRKAYRWQHTDRKKMNRISDAQIERMNELSMRWQTKEELAWDNGFAEAKAYDAEHGAADAPFHYIAPSGFKLGVWLSKCREKYAKGTLSKERIAQLESIHMVWSKARKNDWNDCYAHAKAFYLEHGNLVIPRDYVVDGIWLNKWVSEQQLILRGERPGKSLTEEQKQRLYAISFSAETAPDVRWNQKYQRIRSYYEEHGNIKLPINYRDEKGERLYNWLSQQRMYYKKGKLNERRMKLLREIGITNS